MSRAQLNPSQSNVEDWLSGKRVRGGPDDLDADKGTKIYPHVRHDASRDHTPEASEKGSSGVKADRRRKTTQEQSRPMTPPSEEALDRERARVRDRDRERNRDRHRSSQREGDERPQERPRRHHREEPRAYPPRSDRGRPKRPALNTALTTPNFPRDSDQERERHRRRRYSHSSSPPPPPPPPAPAPARRGEAEDAQSSRRHHRREPPSTTSSHHRDRRDRDRDGAARSRAGSTVGSTAGSTAGGSARRARRPSLASAAPKGGRRSSFSFLSDPRFTAAATAALNAGATAAVGNFGAPDSGVKVARAALGAAAMNAFNSPAATGKAPAEAVGAHVAGLAGPGKRGRRR